MTCLECYRKVAKVFAVCHRWTREVIKKAKENSSQFLHYTFHNLRNLTRPRMNATNSKNTF